MGEQGFTDAGHGGRARITEPLGRPIDPLSRAIKPNERTLLLHQHPLIREAAVIGLPDPKTGERACAVVVMAEESTSLSLSEATGFLRSQQLIAQKLPEQLEVLDTLPRNATGKVLKHELRKRFVSEPRL